jgi:hypothetical protein
MGLASSANAVRAGRQRAVLLDALFDARFTARIYGRVGKELATRIAVGGYPAALARTTPRRSAAWYRGYIETMIQRDVRGLARIASLDVLPRVLAVAAGQTARLLNVTDLAASFQLSRPTIKDYVTLLERVFLLEPLPPWHSNRLSRLVKTPKLHLGDTGVACAVLGLDAEALWDDRSTLGQLLETFVFSGTAPAGELARRRHPLPPLSRQGWRRVDLVLERGGRELAGVEVKASATVTAADFRGLRKLRDAAGKRFAAGVVLYDGESSVGFGEGLFAVPVRALWEMT